MKQFTILLVSICISTIGVAETSSTKAAISKDSTAAQLRIKKKFKLRDDDIDPYRAECERVAAQFYRAFPKEKENARKVTAALFCWKLMELDRDKAKDSKIVNQLACSSALTYMSDEYRISTNDPKFLDLKRSCETTKDPKELKDTNK